MAQIITHPVFEEFITDADYVDVKSIEADGSMRSFIAGMLSYYPWWLVMLYRIREVLVNILGLVKHDKPEVLPSVQAEDVCFTPGEKASFFIVRHAEEEKYWISETPEDKHLKAYFGIMACTQDSGKPGFQVITTIRYRHWTGPLYFNLIRPFHHLVVCKMMKAGARCSP